MKYYDGMGRDVTAYVEGLEKKVKEYEALHPVVVSTPEEAYTSNENIGSTWTTVTVESEKPKPRRRKVTK